MSLIPSPPRLEVYCGHDGLWWWRHRAGNQQIDGASEQGYRSRWYAVRKARRAWRDHPIVFLGER